jgi:superfamily II DNA helicase RecQ
MLDLHLNPEALIPLESSQYKPRKTPGPPSISKQDKINAFNLDTRNLYDQLRACRDAIVLQQGFPPHRAYWVAGTKALIALAVHKPATAETMADLPGLQKGTRGEYLYDLLNVIQAHLKMDLETEPEGWKKAAIDRRKEEEARKVIANTEVEGQGDS